MGVVQLEDLYHPRMDRITALKNRLYDRAHALTFPARDDDGMSETERLRALTRTHALLSRALAVYESTMSRLYGSPLCWPDRLTSHQAARVVRRVVLAHLKEHHVTLCAALAAVCDRLDCDDYILARELNRCLRLETHAHERWCEAYRHTAARTVVDALKAHRILTAELFDETWANMPHTVRALLAER